MVLLLIACGADTDPSASSVGPEGGLVEGAGVQLDIPAGALDEAVEIRIVDLGTEPPEPYEGLSTVWSFEPDGLVFAEPVTVSLPFREHPLPRLFWSAGDAYIEREGATYANGRATASIDHFSTAFVAIEPIRVHDEVYEPAPADILFVIDNSCSMYEFQEALGNEMPAVFETLTGSGLDFHIGAITTDTLDPTNGQGKLRYVGDVRFIEPSTPDPAGVFETMANMGTSGWYDEKGRTAAYTMVEINPDIPRNEGFLRADATLDFVFVSDEQDVSGPNPLTAAEFVDWMAELKDTPAMTRAHALVQLPDQLCNLQGSAGVDYAFYATQSGGTVVDLCSSDFAAPLGAMVEDRLAGGVIQFDTEPSEVVSVRLEEQALDLQPDEYSLEAAVLRFDRGVVPLLGERVVVRYRP